MDPLYDQAKQLYPNASDDEIMQGISQIRQENPNAADDEILKSASAIKQAKDDGSFMKQMVNQDVKNKYGLADRQKIVDQNTQEASGPDWAAGLAALGAGLQGKDAAQAGMAFRQQSEAERQKRLDAFDRDKKQYLFDRDDASSQEKLAQEMDPNSEYSKIAKELAISMGMSPDRAKDLTAAKFKDFSPALQKKYEIAQRSLDRREIANSRRDEKELRNLDREQKMEERQLEFATPYGLANTKDDAKKLKEAHESKSNFDSKMQEMIALREKYGGEVFNRDAVGRGKALAKDLLLEYKNMAKLGVLSKSDEDIINAIIPEDPLAFSGASVLGQDPIIHKMKKFQQDSDRDFATRVATRTREGKPQGLKATGMPGDVAKGFEPDVMDYAKKHGITPEQAQAVKMQRTAVARQ
jgi:hypothetical protein